MVIHDDIAARGHSRSRSALVVAVGHHPAGGAAQLSVVGRRLQQSAAQGCSHNPANIRQYMLMSVSARATGALVQNVYPEL